MPTGRFTRVLKKGNAKDRYADDTDGTDSTDLYCLRRHIAKNKIIIINKNDEVADISEIFWNKRYICDYTSNLCHLRSYHRLDKIKSSEH